MRLLCSCKLLNDISEYSPFLYWHIDLGAAYGTAKSGVGICSMGVLKPDLIFKSIVPIIMAGILGIYGLIVAVILNGKGKYKSCTGVSWNLLNWAIATSFILNSSFKYVG